MRTAGACSAQRRPPQYLRTRTQQTARGNRDQEQEPDETKQKERTPVGHKENWVSFPIRISVQGLQDFIPKFLDLERRKGKQKQLEGGEGGDRREEGVGEERDGLPP